MPNQKPLSSVPLRHLPTLTEVVKPAPMPGPVAVATTDAAVLNRSTDAQRLLDQLTPWLEDTLRQSAHEAVEAHLRVAMPLAVESLRKAIVAALASHPPRL